MDITSDCREHDRPLASLIGFLHVRLEERDGGLHRLGGLQHERKLHLTRGEQIPDGLHAGQQDVVHDLECGEASSECLREIFLEPVPVAVDDAQLEPAFDRPTGPVLAFCVAAVAPSKIASSSESGS